MSQCQSMLRETESRIHRGLARWFSRIHRGAQEPYSWLCKHCNNMPWQGPHKKHTKTIKKLFKWNYIEFTVDIVSNNSWNVQGPESFLTRFCVQNISGAVHVFHCFSRPLEFLTCGASMNGCKLNQIYIPTCEVTTLYTTTIYIYVTCVSTVHYIVKL